jgi:hypothetical protein
MINCGTLLNRNTYCLDMHLAQSLILSCGIRSGAGEFPHNYGNEFVYLRGSSEKKDRKTHAIFGIEHESDVRWFDHTVRTWGQTNRLDGSLPQVDGLWSNNNFPEPSGNSAEAKKVPWVKMSHDLSKTAFVISFYILSRAPRCSRDK